MNAAESKPPYVATQIGRELLDIHTVCTYAGMSDKQIHAAILGRTGINASSWGDPNRRNYLDDHSPKSSGAAIGDAS